MGRRSGERPFVNGPDYTVNLPFQVHFPVKRVARTSGMLILPMSSIEDAFDDSSNDQVAIVTTTKKGTWNCEPRTLQYRERQLHHRHPLLRTFGIPTAFESA